MIGRGGGAARGAPQWLRWHGRALARGGSCTLHHHHHERVGGGRRRCSNTVDEDSDGTDGGDERGGRVSVCEQVEGLRSTPRIRLVNLVMGSVREWGVRVGPRTAQASTAQSEAQASLPELRDGEIAAAAGLRRLKLEQDNLDAEAQRAEEMIARLQAQIETVLQDVARETQSLADAEAQLTRLAEEEAEIRASISDDEQAAEAEAAAALAEAEATLSESEATYDAANRAAAEYAARKQALETTLAQNAQRRERLLAEQTQAQNTRGDVENAISADFDVAARRSELQDLDAKDAQARQALTDSEAAYRAARETQSAAAEPAVQRALRARGADRRCRAGHHR